jgi:hypothetical protein
MSQLYRHWYRYREWWIVHCANTPNYLNRKKSFKVAMPINLTKKKIFDNHFVIISSTEKA